MNRQSCLKGPVNDVARSSSPSTRFHTVRSPTANLVVSISFEDENAPLDPGNCSGDLVPPV